MRTFFVAIAIVLVILSCSSANKQAEKSVSTDQTKIIRFDSDMFDYVSSPSESKKFALENEYKKFLPYFSQIIVGGEHPDFEKLQKYFSHPQLKKLYADTETKFADLTAVEEELTQVSLIADEALNKKLPPLYAHVSGLKQNAIVADSLISLSLDKYLGNDYALYSAFLEPYQLISMSPEYISRDYVKAWVLSEFIPGNQGKNLLQAMVDEGKVLYLLETLLPGKSEQILIGYTPQQMDWCKKNEKKIWRFMIERKHLYSTDAYGISNYIAEAPYTTTLVPESAPRAGQFIGWQIVKRYMKNTRQTPLGLIQDSAENILNASKYNP